MSKEHVIDNSLHIAAQSGNVKNAKILLDWNSNPNKEGLYKNTPLHYAARSGSKVIVELLLNHGANPNQENDVNRTPLHIAAENGRVKIVNYLLLRGCDINKEDINGNTPLIAAIYSGRQKTIRVLLDQQADINKQNARGNTPLHIAVMKFEYGGDIVKLLLSYNPDTHIKNVGGYTPIDEARRSSSSNKNTIISILNKHEEMFLAQKVLPLLLAHELDEESFVFKEYIGKDMFNLIMGFVLQKF